MNDQTGVADTVRNTNSGIELRTPFSPAGTSTNVLAAGNLFRPTTFAAGSSNRAGSQSLTNASKQFSSSLNQVSKTLSDTFKKVTGGLTARPKASDSTNEE